MQQTQTKPRPATQTQDKAHAPKQTTTKDAHDALFGNENTQSAPPKTLQELKQGIEQYIKNKHSRQ
jgi:hypothetical protein